MLVKADGSGIEYQKLKLRIRFKKLSVKYKK